MDRRTTKKGVLQGVKVFDMSWVITGPQATKMLANCGATVIRLESMKRLDIQRTYPPFAGGKPGVNRSGTFAVYHDGKYGVRINLRDPRGLALAKKLIAWADVVVENMAPGVLERLGLDYGLMRQVKENIILARASLFGQSGPYAKVTGFGQNLQAYSSTGVLLGWPDRGPLLSTAPWTDFPSASMLAVAIMAALDRLKRTGRGTCIDFSQHQAALGFLAPTIAHKKTERPLQVLLGNRDPLAAPHGVYPTREPDAWVAIAACTDDQWDALVTALGEQERLGDKRLKTLAGRKEREDELDSILAEWTIHRDPEESMGRLQQAGIPAGIVADGRSLHRDVQLHWRNHFWRIPHSELGPFAYESQPFQFSLTAIGPSLPSPRLGEHTEYVLKEIVKLSDAEYADLLQAGVFE